MGEREKSDREMMEKWKEKYQDIKIPEDGKKKMEERITMAKMDKKRDRRKRTMRNTGIAAAALALLILPNTSQTVAYAMENIPVIGAFFKVVTIRDYQYDDGHNSVSAKVPQIVADGETDTANSGAAESVNKSVAEYTDELIAAFEADMVEEGYKNLDVSYETVTDTDEWFTLAVHVVETEASGYEFARYYHIDKKTGQTAELQDLFKDGADYVTPITDEIIRQMHEQMEQGEILYFLAEDGEPDGFEKIKADQNFYFDADGSLVIIFDEYEVGPGAIGTPQFVIPDSVVADILK